jgi:hypothetical protein
MCNGNSGGSGSNNCMCNGNSGGSGSNNCMCNGNSGGSGSNNCTCNGNSGGSGSNNCTCNGNGNGNSGGSSNNNGNCSNVGQSAQLDIDWGNSGTTAPFKTLSAAELDLDVSNVSIGSHQDIQTNSQNIDIRSLATNVSIMGASSGMTLFAISAQNGRGTSNFNSFADFEAAVAARLNGTTTALRLTADGVYDSASNAFTAQRITILLSN